MSTLGLNCDAWALGAKETQQQNSAPVTTRDFTALTLSGVFRSSIHDFLASLSLSDYQSRNLNGIESDTQAVQWFTRTQY